MKEKILVLIVISLLLSCFANTAVALGPKKLEISAPETANVGEEVTIKVLAEGKPIEGATVHANTEKIGETDANGELKHTFTKPGPKVLTANKKGYIPSVEFTLSVRPRLEISAPSTANVGEDITITVTSEGELVGGASVYVKSDVIGKKRIGETDSNGELVYAFKEKGAYMLIAEKDGYASARKPITVELVEKAKEEIQGKKEKVKEEIEEKKEKIEELVKKLNVENKRVVKVGDEVVIEVTFKESPVSDATIEITKRGMVVESGKTDANGQFVTSFDKRGAYVIKASKEGYRPDRSVVAVVPAPEINIPRFVHVLPVIKPEKPGIIEVNKTAVKELRLKVREKAEDVITHIREIKDLPKEVKKRPPEPVYVYIEINVSVKSENVEEGEITFNVTKEWLINNAIDKNTVTLKRYVNGVWKDLQTKITGEDEKYVYYTTKTQGFSYYAITGEAKEEKAPTPTPTTPTATPTKTPTPTTEKEKKATPTPTTATPPVGVPGFEAVFAVAGLIASFFLIKKRK